MEGTGLCVTGCGQPGEAGGAMRRVGREMERCRPGMVGGRRVRVVGRAGRLESVSVVERLSAVRGGEYACQRGL